MKQSVVVFEQDRRLQAFMGETLQQGGYRVYTTDKEATALIMVIQEAPCLLLLGVASPHSFLEQMRFYQLRDDVPVLLLSDERDDEAARLVRRWELAGHLHKPFGRNELLQMVKRFCDTNGAQA